jgi:hypothetical protein
MAQIVSAVSAKGIMIAGMFGINVPQAGFDIDSWQAALDVFFPVLEDSALLVEFFLDSAPQGCDPEVIALLREYASAWTKEEREVSFA